MAASERTFALLYVWVLLLPITKAGDIALRFVYPRFFWEGDGGGPLRYPTFTFALFLGSWAFAIVQEWRAPDGSLWRWWLGFLLGAGVVTTYPFLAAQWEERFSFDLGLLGLGVATILVLGRKIGGGVEGEESSPSPRIGLLGYLLVLGWYIVAVVVLRFAYGCPVATVLLLAGWMAGVVLERRATQSVMRSLIALQIAVLFTLLQWTSISVAGKVVAVELYLVVLLWLARSVGASGAHTFPGRSEIPGKIIP